MAAFPAAFLDLTSPGGVVMIRWQSRWIGATVTHEGQGWSYCDFDWDAIASGAMAESSQVGLTFALLPTTMAILQDAHAGGWRGRLRIYHYPAEDDGPTPPVSMVLVGSPGGVVSIEAITLNSIRVSLASAQLARGGAAFPPRIADQALIGIPCVLEV